MTTSTHIVFALYPGITQLDFTGPYEVLCRLPGARVTVASLEGGQLRTGHGLTFSNMTRLAEVEDCTLFCVPGAINQSAGMCEPFFAQLRRLAAGATYITSVCNGSLILAAAGLLKGKRSACHWTVRPLLENYGAIPDPARVVRDGNVITGGGVTAGIDFALTVAAEIAGPVVAQTIQLLLEYAPAPPFNAGRPETAPDEVMRNCRRWLAERD
ncbi:MAG: DJ-1/PfpI family protein [Proteobacteria bacterium]|nr:DJ-1/PfpI family protein [Pseudomonadota bacterium]